MVFNLKKKKLKLKYIFNKDLLIGTLETSLVLQKAPNQLALCECTKTKTA